MPIIKNQKAKGPQLKQNVAPSNSKDGDVWYENENIDIRVKTTTPAKGTDTSFKTVLYVGNGTTGHSITGVGFQPDLVWLKHRDNPTLYSHQLYDSVRGIGNYLVINTSALENDGGATCTECLQSFDSNGFTIGSNVGINADTINHVSWCWKADQDATHASHDGERYNTDTGLSIIKYSGNSTTGRIINHSLGQSPGFILIKRLTTSDTNWAVWHKDLPTRNALNINTTAAASLQNWFYERPSDVDFKLYGTAGEVNLTGDDYISYLFAEKPGFSKIGSYTGNGSTTGPIIKTGFSPAFLLIKRIDSTGNWLMLDNVRGTDTASDPLLLSNTPGIETTSVDVVQFLSDGFQLKADHSDSNSLNGQYVYIAFADTSIAESTDWFKTLNSTPVSSYLGVNYGYSAGGYNGSYLSTIQRMQFPFDSGTASIVGNLTYSLTTSSGCNSTQYGYICGGTYGTNVSIIHRVSFPHNSGSASTTGTLNDYIANGGSGMNSSNYGYIIRDSLTSYASYINRITFPFDSGTASRVSTKATKISAPGNCNSSTYGYMMGGDGAGTYRSFINRITFPLDSGTESLVGNLNYTNSYSASCNSSQYGYNCGGIIGSETSIVERILFPFNSGSASVIGNLSITSRNQSSCNSTQHGYICGGLSPYKSTVNRFSFPFDSGTSLIVGNLYSASNDNCGFDGTDFASVFGFMTILSRNNP